MSIRLKKARKFNDWVKVSETEFLIDYPTNEQKQKLDSIIFRENNPATQLEYTRYFLKCVIKDWKGFEERCVVINNELKKDLWLALVSEPEDAAYLFQKFDEALKWTANDEKKFDTSDLQESESSN